MRAWIALIDRVHEQWLRGDIILSAKEHDDLCALGDYLEAQTTKETKEGD